MEYRYVSWVLYDENQFGLYLLALRYLISVDILFARAFEPLLLHS